MGSRVTSSLNKEASGMTSRIVGPLCCVMMAASGCLDTEPLSDVVNGRLPYEYAITNASTGLTTARSTGAAAAFVVVTLSRGARQCRTVFLCDRRCAFTEVGDHATHRKFRRMSQHHGAHACGSLRELRRTARQLINARALCR